MRRLIVVAAMLVLSACGGDSTGPGNVGGVWHLQSIDGQRLPLTGVENGVIVTIKGSTLTMNTNGAYTDVLSYTLVQGTTNLEGQAAEQGSWYASNGTIVFTNQANGSSYQGTVSGRTLTELVSGGVQIYTR